MDKFGSQSINSLRTEIEQALTVVLEKHGLRLQVGTMRYTPLMCKIPVELHIADGSSVEQRAKEEFEACAHLFGFKPEDFGKTIMYGGKRYTVCGLRLNSQKYPIQAKLERTGKIYGLPAYALTGVPTRKGSAAIGQ